MTSLVRWRSRILEVGPTIFSRALRYPLRAVLALGLLQLIAACDRWAVFVNGGGVLSISIVSDGFGLQHRFRVRTRQADGTTRLLDVPASGELRLEGAGPGSVELTLLAPEGGRVSAENPRTVSVGADENVGAVFDVDCSVESP